MMKFKLTEQQQKMLFVTSALRDDEHWAVYISLVNGEAKSLTEIREDFDSTYHEMKYLLEDLIAGGLVEQFCIYEEDIPNLDLRYYRITTPGLIFYVRIFTSLIPSRKTTPRRNTGDGLKT
jgi:hypothetical protein